MYTELSYLRCFCNTIISLLEGSDIEIQFDIHGLVVSIDSCFRATNITTNASQSFYWCERAILKKASNMLNFLRSGFLDPSACHLLGPSQAKRQEWESLVAQEPLSAGDHRATCKNGPRSPITLRSIFACREKEKLRNIRRCEMPNKERLTTDSRKPCRVLIVMSLFAT